MLVIPSGRLTLTRFSQTLKVLSLMLVTLEGITISVKLLHCSKAFLPMLVTPSGRLMLARFSQPLKAYSPMLVTLEGIVISLRLLHS